MNALEKNNFVVTHASASYFAKDLEYYKKIFPNSRLIKDLERCPEFRKKELDARMLTEMLTTQSVCTECILENRGIITLKQKLEDETQTSGNVEKANADLLAIDLTEKFDFNVVKELAALAGVTIMGKNKAALIASIEQWKKEPTPQATNTTQDTEQATPAPVADSQPATSTEETDKKKEGQE